MQLEIEMKFIKKNLGKDIKDKSIVRGIPKSFIKDYQPRRIKSEDSASEKFEIPAISAELRKKYLGKKKGGKVWQQKFTGNFKQIGYAPTQLKRD